MTRKCFICEFTPERRQAVEQSIASGLSLKKIENQIGISKSSLSRHSQHMGGNGSVPAAVQDTSTNSTDVDNETVARSEASEVEAVAGTTAEQKRTLWMQTLEHLFGEALQGLDDAKQATTIERPNGTRLEVPGGNMMARVGFLREAKSLHQLRGEVDGVLTDAGRTNVAIRIVVPDVLTPRDPSERCPVIDIALPKR